MIHSRKKTGLADAYLHGFSLKEQTRLRTQAQFLKKSVHDRLPFQDCQQLLEVGCGVGAQTEILLQDFPRVQIAGVDANPAQIRAAKGHLRSYVKKGRVQFIQADALHLPFDEGAFDGAFVCWFLEHVQNPIEILNEIRRTLKVGATLVCNEVLNATFYLHPYSPATQKFWFEFNDYQWSKKGDPFVGGKLANYLLKAGYQDIETKVITHHYDHRTPKMRARFIAYWSELLLSGAPGLIEERRITEKEIRQMKEELKRLAHDPDAVFFYSWVQARAKAW